MNIKVIKEFIAGEEVFPAGHPADIDDEIAGRAIGAGWAVPANGEKVKGKEGAIEAQKKPDKKEE